MFNIILVFLTSLCIQFCSVGITPYNMLSNNQSGVGDEYIDIVLDRIRNNYQGYWGDSYRWVLNVPRESIIVIKGVTLWGNYNNEYTVLVPNEYNNPNVSSQIQCNSYTLDQDNVVDSVSVNFSNYVQFFTTLSYINDPYIDGFKPLQFDSSNNWELVYCYVPIYSNGQEVVTVDDDIIVDTTGGFTFGSLGGDGHSPDSSPIDALNNNGVSWSAHTSASPSVGHSQHTTSTHFNISDSTPDINDDKQINLLFMSLNKLGDIVENTGQTVNNLFGINNNIVQGFSAVFNAISSFNDNVVSYVEYIKEPFNSEKFIDHFDSSSGGQVIRSGEELVNRTSILYNSVVTGLMTTEQNELVIPIDFTVWNFTSDYGRIAPMDQIYYMRFGFLDETKTLWQPLFISLLYFAIVLYVAYDVPNLLRGASYS